MQHILVEIRGKRDLVFATEAEASAYVEHILMPQLLNTIVPGLTTAGTAFVTDLPVNAKMVCDDGVWSLQPVH